ncbi:MAG: hypothetical protein MZV49_16705 [Rhodopseudomonas palustris]|nr:hypothetical protein [Rhodopseudomonas palustris]
MLNVRLARLRSAGGGDAGAIGGGGRLLGEVEEIFHRDAGARRHLRVRRRGAALARAIARDRGARRPRRSDQDPKVPSYAGGKFPLSTYLADRVRRHARRSEAAGRSCPTRCRDWLELQAGLLDAAGCAASCWSRPSRAATAITSSAYPFEGRLAHQTLGMLLTRRMERAPGCGRSASSPTNTRIAIWALGDCRRDRARTAATLTAVRPATCWATISRNGWRSRALMKRTFRDVRDHLRPDRAPLSRRGEEPAGR